MCTISDLINDTKIGDHVSGYAPGYGSVDDGTVIYVDPVISVLLTEGGVLSMTLEVKHNGNAVWLDDATVKKIG